MAGIIGSCTSDTFPKDVSHLAMSANFGIGVAHGSGRSLEICKYLFAMSGQYYQPLPILLYMYANHCQYCCTCMWYNDANGIENLEVQSETRTPEIKTFVLCILWSIREQLSLIALHDIQQRST